MINAINKGYYIDDPLYDNTGATIISLADMIAVDTIMDALFNDRSNITGFVDSPVTRDACEEAFSLFKTNKDLITLDNYDTVRDIYKDLTVRLNSIGVVKEVSSFEVSYLLNDGLSSSFTLIRAILEDGELEQCHYIIPLFSQVYIAGMVPMLHLDGNQKLHYAYIPVRDGFESTIIDTDALIELFYDKGGNVLGELRKIPHTKICIIPVDKYAVQYANLYEEPLEPVRGIGLSINSNSTLYTALGDTKASIDKFDLNDMPNKLLLVYDNRSYVDNILEDSSITVKALSDSQISYVGLSMDEEHIEPYDQVMAYAEANTAKKAGRVIEKAKRIPSRIIDKGKELASKIRTVLVEFRRADDDTLRERIINDEFVPILDNSMQWLIGGATSFGLYFLVAANPLIALLGGLGAKQLKNIRDRERREKALKMIKDELEIIDEKIADAKNKDDRQQKYALMRIKQNLEGKMFGITKSRKYSN